MKIRLLILSLLLSFNIMAQSGGSGNCHVTVNPNTLTDLEVQDLVSDCQVVINTTTSEEWHYYASLTQGTRWVKIEEIPSGGLNGQILSRDVNGDLVWINSPSGADNLGNHIATQNIQTNGNWISSDGDDEGVFVDGSGNVGIGTSTPTRTLTVNGDVRTEGMISVGYDANDNNFAKIAFHHSHFDLANRYFNGIAYSNSSGSTFYEGGGSFYNSIPNSKKYIWRSHLWNGTSKDYTTLMTLNAASGNLEVSPDKDITTTLGRAKVFSAVSDYMYLSHFNNGTSSNYALNQNASGSTSINAPTGQNVSLKINNVTKALLRGSNGYFGINITSPTYQFHVRGNAMFDTGVDQEYVFINSSGTIQFGEGIPTATIRIDQATKFNFSRGGGNYHLSLNSDNTSNFIGTVAGLDAVNTDDFVTLGQLQSGSGSYWTKTGNDLNYDLGNVGISDGNAYKINGSDLLSLNAAQIVLGSSIQDRLKVRNLNFKTDATLGTAQDGYALRYNDATGLIEPMADVSTPTTTFLGLNDTQNSYTGFEGYALRVNSLGNAVEFAKKLSLFMNNGNSQGFQNSSTNASPTITLPFVNQYDDGAIFSHANNDTSGDSQTIQFQSSDVTAGYEFDDATIEAGEIVTYCLDKGNKKARIIARQGGNLDAKYIPLFGLDSHSSIGLGDLGYLAITPDLVGKTIEEVTWSIAQCNTLSAETVEVKLVILRNVSGTGICGYKSISTPANNFGYNDTSTNSYTIGVNDVGIYINVQSTTTSTELSGLSAMLKIK